MDNDYIDNINILQELGFKIYPIKSCLTPKQKIIFLGFLNYERNLEKG